MFGRPIAYLGDHTALTVTAFGRKIYVDTRDISIAPHILMQGEWEPWITRMLTMNDMLKPGKHFVDVGANVGWYSLLAANAGCEVAALEPSPRMASLLRKSVAVNGFGQQIKVHEVAATDEPGTVTLQFEHTNAGGAHVGPKVGSTETHHAPGMRIESWCDKPVDIIKVDVEGHEGPALRGAEGIIDDNPEIVLLIEHNDGAEGMREWLRGKSFHIQWVNHQSTLEDIADFDALPPGEMLYAKRR